MRLKLLAGAALALCLAAPAAAQPEPAAILQDALRRIAQNHGDVQSYTMVLAHRDVRVGVYVYADEGGWRVQSASGPLSPMMRAAVAWPLLGAAGDVSKRADYVWHGPAYVRADQVGGRRAHVLAAALPGEVANDYGQTNDVTVDSASLWVDAQTRQLLRLVLAGRLGTRDRPDPDGSGIGFDVEYADYQEHQGLTVPMRMRMRVRLEVDRDDPGYEELRQQAQGRLEEVRALGEEEDERQMVEMFATLVLQGEVEVPITVERVRVNPRRPRWIEKN